VFTHSFLRQRTHPSCLTPCIGLHTSFQLKAETKHPFGTRQTRRGPYLEVDGGQLAVLDNYFAVDHRQVHISYARSAQNKSCDGIHHSSRKSCKHQAVLQSLAPQQLLVTTISYPILANTSHEHYLSFLSTDSVSMQA
jgi:hypothetical protein